MRRRASCSMCLSVAAAIHGQERSRRPWRANEEGEGSARSKASASGEALLRDASALLRFSSADAVAERRASDSAPSGLGAGGKSRAGTAPVLSEASWREAHALLPALRRLLTAPAEDQRVVWKAFDALVPPAEMQRVDGDVSAECARLWIAARLFRIHERAPLQIA